MRGAIVFVHGSVVTGEMWLPQARELSAEFDVFTPDLPGHGTNAGVPFTMDAAIRTLHTVIAGEAHGRALVAGISLGGYVAIELAARHPGLVAGLALSGCTVRFTRALRLYLRAVSVLLRRGWIAQNPETAERKVRRMFPPDLADVAAAQLKAGVYPQALSASFAAMAAQDFRLRLARYPGPVLILNGERDSSSRRGEAWFTRGMTSVRVGVVPDAGHACNLDRPAAYNAAIREFAASVRLSAGPDGR